MNKIFSCIMVLALAAFALSACTEIGSGDDSGPVLSVAETVIEVPAEGGEFRTCVTSDGPVTVSVMAAWCVADVVEGELIVTVEPNGEYSGRKTSVMLSAAKCDDVPVEVIQAGAGPANSAACDLMSFEIGVQDGIDKAIVFNFDQESRVLTAKHLKWIEKESPEMLVPTFETNGVQVLVDGSEIVSGETAISFADPVTLVVKAENGDELSYTVDLNCPQINRELPVLHIRPDRLIADKENYVQTYIELYDKTPGSTGEGWWDSEEKGKIEMRGRGNSTWGLPKKPFRLKFTEKYSPVGLDHAKEKSWVILAQDMDKSLIRTHIAFEYSRILFNKAENYHDDGAILFTPCSRFINVYFTGDYYYSDAGQTKHLDGEYIGVYQMSDQMNRADGRIAVDKLNASHGSDPDKITGGYIIETDLHEGNQYSPRKGIRMTYKYPEDDDFDQAQYDYITNFIGKAEDALYSTNYKNPDVGWRKYFDEKTLADFIIIKELVGDLDGYTSTYMYKRRGVDKLFFGPVWDCDKGWNNDKRVPHQQYPPLSSLMIYAGFWMPAYVDNDWFQTVWTDETFRAFVAKRWADKKDELIAVTNRILDEVPQEMGKAIDANFTVWQFYYQYSGEANMPAKTYPEEIERIRTLTEQRATLLDNLFNK